MSECPNCGAVDEPEHGIIVGAVDGGQSSCTVCRTEHLKENTVLSPREAQVAAHKQITGATHETIAERVNLSKSSVDEYSRRLNEKIRKAANTSNELEEVDDE